jgi:plasmid stabilization system protein ParE
MKTKWHPRAQASYRQVARYINTKFGRKARQDFILKVKDMERQLKQSPNIGQIDPLYADRAKTYRSVIINGLNKMVYYIDSDTIWIAGFWDTRQEPEAQAEQTE